MPNFEIHGFAQVPRRAQDIAQMLRTELSQNDHLLHDAVITDCKDDVSDGLHHGAPFIRIASTVGNPAIPTLAGLARMIKPVCDKKGLDIETMELAGFYPKGEPLPE